MTRIAMLLAYSLVLMSVVDAQRPRLWDVIQGHDRTAGALEVSVSPMYPSRSVSDLVGEADLVIRGHVLEGRPVLSEDESQIVTVSRVRVNEVLAGPSAALLIISPLGKDQLIRQVGGELDLGGTKVRMKDTSLRVLRPNEEVVLFLLKVPNEDAFEIAYGPFGAFEVQDGRLGVTSDAAMEAHQELAGKGLEALRSRIQAVLNRQP